MAIIELSNWVTHNKAIKALTDTDEIFHSEIILSVINAFGLENIENVIERIKKEKKTNEEY